MPTDKEMLDWLDKQGSHYKWNIQLETVREAIAAKMKDVTNEKRKNDS